MARRFGHEPEEEDLDEEASFADDADEAEEAEVVDNLRQIALLRLEQVV